MDSVFVILHVYVWPWAEILLNLLYSRIDSNNLLKTSISIRLSQMRDEDNTLTSCWHWRFRRSVVIGNGISAVFKISVVSGTVASRICRSHDICRQITIVIGLNEVTVLWQYFTRCFTDARATWRRGGVIRGPLILVGARIFDVSDAHFTFVVWPAWAFLAEESSFWIVILAIIRGSGILVGFFDDLKRRLSRNITDCWMHESNHERQVFTENESYVCNVTVLIQLLT